MLLKPNKVLSFGEHKAILRELQKDNLELMNTLHKTTLNLQAAMFAYKALLKHCRKSLSDEEIDDLLVDSPDAPSA